MQMLVNEIFSFTRVFHTLPNEIKVISCLCIENVVLIHEFELHEQFVQRELTTSNVRLLIFKLVRSLTQTTSDSLRKHNQDHRLCDP